jgi:hypothetical protein
MRLLALFLVLNSAISFASDRQAQLKVYRSGVVRPGKGIGALTIGLSTADDIKRTLGETPSAEKSSRGQPLDYSFGVSFETDARGILKKIYIGKNPIAAETFLGATDKGVKLGDSEETVYAKYGKPIPKFSYGNDLPGFSEGILFKLDKKSKLVLRMIIFDPKNGPP